MHRTSRWPRALRASLLVAAALGGAPACATRVAFEPSNLLPSAAGIAVAELDENGNSWVEIELKYLAKPDGLQPPRATYVVWAESYFGRQVLLGQVKVDDLRRATWHGTVPFDHFRLLVSAEDRPWPDRPREPLLLKTDYVRPRSQRF